MLNSAWGGREREGSKIRGKRKRRSRSGSRLRLRLRVGGGRRLDRVEGEA